MKCSKKSVLGSFTQRKSKSEKALKLIAIVVLDITARPLYIDLRLLSLSSAIVSNPSRKDFCRCQGKFFNHCAISLKNQEDLEAGSSLLLLGTGMSQLVLLNRPGVTPVDFLTPALTSVLTFHCGSRRSESGQSWRFFRASPPLRKKFPVL
ncbi:hypothetical protein PoB_001466700 [Plakobranchus ocellatus]|uniref:Uncharacterized protein n=1 Tax=Plakobranchus ocellatus TaxID=259542 RepID=A0AAV3Z0Z8_9GAST|nr:hypothetical protein PoB_001466700 [Plakobranchus ocellatus]